MLPYTFVYAHTSANDPSLINGKIAKQTQAGSQGQEVASALAVDPTTGDVLVCGSTSGGLFDREGAAIDDDFRLPLREHQPNAAPGGGEGRGKAESFCAKLDAADGKVSF